jgi:hypothetical protein
MPDMTPEERERVGQALGQALSSDEVSGIPESERTWQRQRSLDAHDRIMASKAAEAARDVLHDSSPLKEPGSYTVYEARDRAAHTPSIAREGEK